MASSPIVEKSPVLHVVVVGFHHKKGCQVKMVEVCARCIPSIWEQQQQQQQMTLVSCLSTNVTARNTGFP